MNKDKNIVLIGMPAIGKSVVGVLLARRLGRYFLDTDVFIQAIIGRTLQEIIEGELKFIRLRRNSKFFYNFHALANALKLRS